MWPKSALAYDKLPQPPHKKVAPTRTRAGAISLLCYVI